MKGYRKGYKDLKEWKDIRKNRRMKGYKKGYKNERM